MTPATKTLKTFPACTRAFSIHRHGVRCCLLCTIGELGHVPADLELRGAGGRDPRRRDALRRALPRPRRRRVAHPTPASRTRLQHTFVRIVSFACDESPRSKSRKYDVKSNFCDPTKTWLFSFKAKRQGMPQQEGTIDDIKTHRQSDVIGCSRGKVGYRVVGERVAAVVHFCADTVNRCVGGVQNVALENSVQLIRVQPVRTNASCTCRAKRLLCQGLHASGCQHPV